MMLAETAPAQASGSCLETAPPPSLAERLGKAAVHRSSRNEDSRLTVNSCQECRCRLHCPVDGA